MSYATRTSVSAERSKMEIEATLKRYGADQFVSGWRDSAAMIGFRMGNRMIRFVLPLPGITDFYTYETTYRGQKIEKTRNDAAAQQACEQEIRRRFRALSLVIKAKLEAVASGITTFEEEFLAHIVLPGGQTVYEHARGELKSAFENQKTPELLLGFGAGQ